MQAVVVSPPKPNSAQLRRIARPQAPDDGALVRVIEVGIDGTDRELQEGSYGQLPPGEEFMVLGHEALGTIEQAGRRSRFRPGDYVIPTVRRPGDCPNCRAGESDFCSDGNYFERGIWRADGYMAEAFAEHDLYLVPVPKELRPVAVLLEPVSIAEKAWRQTQLIQRRLHWNPSNAWIFGAGPLGILIALLLRARGLTTLVYSRERADSVEAQLVRACGATYVSNADEPFEQLQKRTAPDLIMEATGAPQLVLAVPQLLARNGVGCLLGVSRPSGAQSLDEQKYNNDMVLGNRLVFGCVNSHRVDFEQGVKDLGGYQQLWPGLVERLFTRRVPLAGFRDALDRRKSDIKVVLEVNKG